MPKYAVNLDGLDHMIAKIGGFNRQIEEWLVEVDARVARLQSTWDGQTALAQQQAHDQWIAGARQMNAALDELRDSARSAHANYVSAIAANRKMWT